MSAITIDMRQVDRLGKKLNRVFKAFPKEVKNMIENTGAEIAGIVQKITPIDTGNLKTSIQSKKKNKYTQIVQARRADAMSFNPNVKDYDNVIEVGRGSKIKNSKNRNTRAKSDSSGAYKMFKESEEKANKEFKKQVTNLLKRLARKI